MSEVQKVLDELKVTHEALKTHVDQRIEEVRSAGYSKSETDERIAKIEADLSKQVELYKDLQARANRPQMETSAHVSPDEELRRSAFTKFVRYGLGETGRAAMSPEEMRALSSNSDALGQFLVPTTWETELLMQAYNAAEIRPVATVRQTGRDSVFMASLSKPSVAWGNANVEVTAQTLSSGGERIEINDLRALILIHNNTLDDAAADIWAELSAGGAAAVSEAEDDAFAVGVGASQPLGIATDTRVLANYTATGVAAALSDSTHYGFDALMGALYTLKKTYRRNATWAMNSATEAAVRQLKDDVGQYLWQPPVQLGAPITILGRPVINPEGLPDIGAGTFPIVIGDFKAGYRIYDRKGVSVQRLVERYAEYNQTGFMLTKRTGGQVVMPEAFACVKVAAS